MRLDTNASNAQVGPTEQIAFHSGGHRLSGVVHFPAVEPSSRAPAVVVCGGFGAIKELRSPGVCEWLAAAGLVALRFDYQGFGASEGSRWRLIPLEQVRNVRDAVSYLQGRAEVDPDRVGVYGISWGGAPAVYAAAIDARIRCVVVNGSPSRGDRWLRALRPHWAWLTFRGRLDADRLQRVATGASTVVPSDEILVPDPRTRAEHERSDTTLDWRFELPLESAEAILEFAPEDVVGSIAPRPLLIVHSGADKLVPLDEAEASYRRAGEPKRLVVVPGAEHHDVYYGPAREMVMSAAAEWFRRYL